MFGFKRKSYKDAKAEYDAIDEFMSRMDSVSNETRDIWLKARANLYKATNKEARKKGISVVPIK